MSQEQFAEAGQFHRTFAGAIERGETNISFSTLGRIADALDVKIEDLFAGLEDEKSGEIETPSLQHSEGVDRSRLQKQIAVLERAVEALKHLADPPRTKKRRKT